MASRHDGDDEDAAGDNDDDDHRDGQQAHKKKFVLPFPFETSSLEAPLAVTSAERRICVSILNSDSFFCFSQYQIQ